MRCSTSLPISSRCALGVCSWIPVVSSSSPPFNQGVGSSSSVACTQRTLLCAEYSPQSSSSASSASRVSTVSFIADETSGSPAGLGAACRPRESIDSLRRLAQHGTQDRLDLLKLLLTGDQRRRELHDRIAPVIGAADQPTPV